MSLNPEQELFFDHLAASLAAFKLATKQAILIDNNRESHLDDAAAAQLELKRSAAQLLFSLGVVDVRSSAVRPMGRVTVQSSTDIYAGGYGQAYWISAGDNPGGDPLEFLRSAFVAPTEDPVRDYVVLGDPLKLIPRL